MRKITILLVLCSLNAWSQNVHYGETYTINTNAHKEKILALASEINICAFSPDENDLATFDLLFNINIWDMANNRIKKQLTDTTNPFVIYDIKYSKSHNLFLAGGDELRIYDSKNYQLRKRIRSTSVYSIAAGSLFFFTSGEDGIIRMWDNEKLTLVDSINNKQSTGSIRLSNSENKLYAGSSSGFVIVYNVDPAARKIHFSDSIKAYDESMGIPKHDITDIDITEKDEYLLVNPDMNAVYLISIAQKSIVKTFVNPDKSEVLSIKSAGNDLYATALESNKIVFHRFSGNHFTESISFHDCNVKDYMGPANLFISPAYRYIAFTNGFGIIHLLERK